MYLVQGLFQEKDYLNGRYFQKRAFYLAAIAAAVMSSKDDLNVEVQYESPGGDPRLTALVIIPTKSSYPLSPLGYVSLIGARRQNKQ